MAAQPVGSFALVLHTHLPFVLGHGRWPHGSDWLMEVAVGSYLPLVEAVGALAASGISPHITIDVSPILAEQFASPAFRTELEDYLRARIRSAQDNRAEFEAGKRADLVQLATAWERRYRDQLDQFERLDGDLVGHLRHLADQGHITLITCAATHGYLPLLSREESVDLQLRLAAATHQRHFGRSAMGIWLPECAYRPRYEWTPPVGPNKGRVHMRRRGIEEFLSQFGLKFFITDAHLMRGGSALSVYRDYYPALHAVPGPQPVSPRPERSPYRPYLIASRGGHGTAAAFVRDPQTTLQVWSRERGYPGDGWYLEFHKKHFPGGLRYWRVTESKSDLGAKLPYEPSRAQEQTRAHAEHFTNLLRTVLSAAPERTEAIVCSPFDTELFGHWWYEGPRWLQEVLTRLPLADIASVDCAAVLQHRPPQDTTTLLEGSWGEGGDHRVWLNHDTEWTWERVYAAEEEFWTVAKDPATRSTESGRRVLAQLARELLLLQASDWQFLITTWAARDYAEARVAEHYATFTRLIQVLRHIASGAAMASADAEFLAAREAQNFPFPDVLTHVMEASRTTAA